MIQNYLHKKPHILCLLQRCGLMQEYWFEVCLKYKMWESLQYTFFLLNLAILLSKWLQMYSVNKLRSLCKLSFATLTIFVLRQKMIITTLLTTDSHQVWTEIWVGVVLVVDMQIFSSIPLCSHYWLSKVAVNIHSLFITVFNTIFAFKIFADHGF